MRLARLIIMATFVLALVNFSTVYNDFNFYTQPDSRIEITHFVSDKLQEVQTEAEIVVCPPFVSDHAVLPSMTPVTGEKLLSMNSVCDTGDLVVLIP